jgi:hypothetical protein
MFAARLLIYVLEFGEQEIVGILKTSPKKWPALCRAGHLAYRVFSFILFEKRHLPGRFLAVGPQAVVIHT